MPRRKPRKSQARKRSIPTIDLRPARGLRRGDTVMIKRRGKVRAYRIVRVGKSGTR